MVEVSKKSNPFLKKIKKGDSFSKKILNKHKKNSNLEKTLMPSGVVFVLDGYWKDKYENFLGVAIPRVRIHRDHNAIEKAEKYEAHSYAKGIDIYLGKDVKPIDTLDGQVVLAHEITHVLQQKYLDISSDKEMIDPSILLEQKAKIVEDRVRVSNGIEKNSSREYFKKWNVLPERSYQARVSNIDKFITSKSIQRFSLSLDDFKEFGSALVDASINQAKNVGGALSEAGSTALNTATSVGKYATSGYTGLVAEGADLLGYEDTAKDFRSATKILKESAVYDLNEASMHLQKSGKYGSNVLGSVVGNQKVFDDNEIKNTKGTIEELTDWKKDEKYNKTVTEFGNKAIGSTLKGVQNLTGDFFTMKYGSWQYKSAEKYTSFVENTGKKLKYLDKTYLQKNIFTESISNSVKGAIDNTIIKPGKKIAKNLEDNKFIESGQDLVKDANISAITMNLSSGSLDGNITTLQNNGIISKEEAKKFKIGKDTALAMTKIAFDIKNAKTKKDIANKRTNTLNTNIAKGKYTEKRVKGLLTVSKNAVKSANYDISKSSIELLSEGSKAVDKYLGVKDSQLSKNLNFLGTLVDNKISYKNLEGIDKIKLMDSSSSESIQGLSLKGAWESTKNIGKGLYHSFFSLADTFSSIVKTSASGYTGLVAEGANLLGYNNISNKYIKVTKSLQQSASDDFKDAKDNFIKSGKYGNNAVSNLVKGKDTYRDIDNVDKIEQEYKKRYNPKDFMRFKDDASDVYKPNEFYELNLALHGGVVGSTLYGPLSLDEIDKRSYSNKKKDINSPLLDEKLEKGEKTVVSKVDSSSGLETYMKQLVDAKNELSYKLVFRGTWPQKFSEALQKHDALFAWDDVVEDGLYRGKRQAEKAKTLYGDFFTKSSKILEKYKFKEIAFVGHSLGGYLANSVMVDFVSSRGRYGNVQPKSIYAETYNALGLTNEELRRYEKAKKESKDTKILSVNHRTEYDPVSHIGVQPDMMVTHTLNDRPKSFLDDILSRGGKIADAHSMDNFTKTFNKYSKTPTITKDKATFFDKYIVDNDFVRMPIAGALLGVGIGVHKAYNFGVEKISQFSNFVSNTASNIKEGVVDGVKWLGDRAVDIKDGVVSGTKKAYNFGVEKVSQFSNFVSNTASSISKGAVNAYNFAEKKSKQFGNALSNGYQSAKETVYNIGDSISTGAKNAYNFAEEKAEKFGDAVSEGWDSVTDLFKFAEQNRHQQQSIKSSSVEQIPSNSKEKIVSMENQLDELSMRIFRQLKSEIALEYVRSGRS